MIGSQSGYKGVFISTATTTQALTGEGVFKGIDIQVAGTSIDIYDDVAGTSNKIAGFLTAGPGYHEFNIQVTNGVKVVTVGVAIVTVIVGT